MAWDWVRKAFRPGRADDPLPTQRPADAPLTLPVSTASMMAPEPVTAPSSMPEPQAAPMARNPSPPAVQAPHHRTVTAATTIHLPWLRPFDERSAKYGVNHRFTEERVAAGESVYEDQQRRLVCIADPGRLVRVWSNLAQLKIWPEDQTWRMIWRSLDEDIDDIVFSIERSDDEDEMIAATGFDIYTERFEGREDLFQEFVALAGNVAVTTVPFVMKSGVYGSSGSGVRFKLDFGENGGRVAAEVFDDSLPPVLNFPYKTVIVAAAPTLVGEVQVAAGEYIAQVRGYRTDDGHVTSINLRGSSGSYNVTGDGIVAALQAGTVEIAEVIEDQMPNF